MSLEQIAINYALAYDAAQKALDEQNKAFSLIPRPPSSDRASVARWSLAWDARVKANRRLGAYKSAFLRAGRKLASEALTRDAS